MNNQVFPTKSNLLQAKNSLSLAKVGYELLDKKRNIMLREMMSLMDDISAVQDQIDVTFSEAYSALQRANFTIGQSEVLNIINAQTYPDDITINFKSIMGVEIPVVKLDAQPPSLSYGFAFTNSMLDDAYVKFLRVKQLTSTLAAIENSVYRLAFAIKQAQKRANALKNIVIPRLEETVSFITGYLEEKERESFTVLKVIKKANKK
jgi:V/A-type H+-transporting ATPase subunit D